MHHDGVKWKLEVQFLAYLLFRNRVTCLIVDQSNSGDWANHFAVNAVDPAADTKAQTRLRLFKFQWIKNLSGSAGANLAVQNGQVVGEFGSGVDLAIASGI